MRKDKKKDKSSTIAGKRNQRTLSERITTDSERKAKKKKKLKEDAENARRPETKSSGEQDTINQVVIPEEKARSDKLRKLKNKKAKA